MKNISFVIIKQNLFYNIKNLLRLTHFLVVDFHILNIHCYEIGLFLMDYPEQKQHNFLLALNHTVYRLLQWLYIVFH